MFLRLHGKSANISTESLLWNMVVVVVVVVVAVMMVVMMLMMMNLMVMMMVVMILVRRRRSAGKWLNLGGKPRSAVVVSSLQCRLYNVHQQ